MKNTIAIVLAATFFSVSAESARISYAPAQGTKTRYRMETTTSAKVLELKMPASAKGQTEQLRQTLEQASSTKVTMDNQETVLKVDADGSRIVSSEMGMTVTSQALPNGMKAAFNIKSRYAPSGTVEIQSFELDRKRTSKELADAMAGQTGSFKNLFRQASNYGFYGKTLSEKPIEVRIDVPSPSMAANINLKYTMRSTYRLSGRTPKGGYLIAFTTRLEPASANTKQNNMDLKMSLSGEEASGEIALLPDGRVERLTQPMTMVMDAVIGSKGEQMTYKMQVQVNSKMNIVP